MKETKRDRFNKAVILAYAKLGGSLEGLNNELGNELCNKCFQFNADPKIAAEMLLLADKTEYQKKVIFEYANFGGSLEGLDDETVLRALEGGYHIPVDPETAASAMVELDRSRLDSE